MSQDVKKPFKAVLMKQGVTVTRKSKAMHSDIKTMKTLHSAEGNPEGHVKVLRTLDFHHKNPIQPFMEGFLF